MSEAIELLTEINQTLTKILSVLEETRSSDLLPTSLPTNEDSPTNFIDFYADTLVLSTDDNGKPVYRARGFPYVKFGVRVWDEVLPKIGVDPAQLQPGPNPFGAHVRCLANGEGNPKKVVELAPSGQSASNPSQGLNSRQHP
jgi:hypothetical protein